MKLIALFIAAAAAATLAATPAVGKRTPTATIASAAQVAAAEGVRQTVWKCQQATGLPKTRSELTYAELGRVGSRYALWITRRWESRLAACAAVRAHRADIVKKLEAGLAGSPLAPWADELEAAGREWNVNPFLVAAISGTESTFGRAACYDHANAWGIASCGITFADFGEGLRYTTRLLRQHYPIDAGDLVAVGSIYAACGRCWADRTGWFMQRYFGSSPTLLVYPRK